MPDIKEVQYFTTNYLPKWFIWAMHITIAIIFLTLGGLYLGYKEHSEDTNDLITIGEAMSWVIIIFGILMITYHGDLFLMWKNST